MKMSIWYDSVHSIRLTFIHRHLSFISFDIVVVVVVVLDFPAMSINFIQQITISAVLSPFPITRIELKIRNCFILAVCLYR